MKIKEPTKPATHPDRMLACEEALEGAVQALIATAVAAKWGEAEVVEAIITLAEHHSLAMAENHQTDLDIRAAHAKLGTLRER